VSPRRRAVRAVLDVAKDCDAKGGFVQVEGHRRGGYWIGAQGERQVYGYTLENAKAVQRILAQAAGWKPRTRGIEQYCTIEKASGELAHAIAEPERYARDESAPRTARAREKAIAEGRCVVCRREPAREGRKTCFWCSYQASVRVSVAREAKKSA
jgi:hypothetical protein